MQLLLGFCFKSKSSGSEILLTCAGYWETYCVSHRASHLLFMAWRMKLGAKTGTGTLGGTVAAHEQSDQPPPVTGAAASPCSVRCEPVGVPTHFPIAH